jgi:hypothetical protein
MDGAAEQTALRSRTTKVNIALPYQGFREFLDALRKAGELIEVDRAVSPELEVAKAMRKSAAVSGPAIIFKNNGTAFPVAGGVYNTRSKALIAFQTTEKDAFERVLHGMATRTSPVVAMKQRYAGGGLPCDPDHDRKQPTSQEGRRCRSR